jgi:Immunity protein 53
MSLTALESWYAGQCHDECEHGDGVRIDTLDNPGWRLHIGLHGTKRQDAVSPKAPLTRSQRRLEILLGG